MKTQIQFLVLLLCISMYSCSSDDGSSNPPSNNTIEASINEYPTTGDVVTTVTSNLSGNVTFTMTSQSVSQAFGINNSSGELSVLAWQVFDYETNPVMTVTVDATNGTDTENKIIIISINNIDDISAFLNSSRTAYNNATNGEWVRVLQSEYNDLANYLSDVTKSGQSDGMFQSAGNNISTGGANYTVSNNNGLTMSEGSYLFAFRYYTHQNNTVDSNVKISETSHQNNFETVGENLPPHDSGYNYFVLKGNNTATTTEAYLGIYESNTIGFKSNSGSTYYYESGDTEDLTNDNNNRAYLYQGLSTTLKQWD